MHLHSVLRAVILTILLAALCAPARAQNFCPANINFESGNLGNWNFYTGLNNGVSGISTLSDR